MRTSPTFRIQVFLKRMVSAMMINWSRAAAVSVLAAGTTVAGAAAIARAGQNRPDAAPKNQNQPAGASAKEAPSPPVDFDSPEALRRQAERRVAAARRRLVVQHDFYREGKITIDRYVDASRQLLLAETAARQGRDFEQRRVLPEKAVRGR